MEAEVSSRRTRVQYGKAAKRVDDRRSTAKQGATLPVTRSGDTQDTEKVGYLAQARPRQTTSRLDATQGAKIEPLGRATRSRAALSPAKSPQSPPKLPVKAPSSKRKRAASPATSEAPDEINILRATPKAKRTTQANVSPRKTREQAISPIKPASQVDSLSKSKRRREMQSPARPTTPQNPSVSVEDGSPNRLRDLSSFFPVTESSMSRPASPTKAGLVKRMLSKSKTEPSLSPSSHGYGSPYTGSPVRQSHFFDYQKTASLPLVFPKPMQTLQPQFVRPDPTPQSPHRQGSPSPQSHSPVRTYSRTRSFLVPIGKVPDSNAEASPGDEEMHDVHQESYTDLRTRWGVDNSEDPTLNVPINDLNSLSEMRSRGEARRFLDEVGYLVEGLEPAAGKAVHRSTAIEIVTKMCDETFVRKSADADFAERTWIALTACGAGTGEDKVLDAALAIFVALATRDPSRSSTIVTSERYSEFIQLAITTPPDGDTFVTPPMQADAAWLKRLGISRVDRALLSNLRLLLIENSKLESSEGKPSIRVLASSSIASVVSAIQPTTSLIESVIESLVSEFNSLLTIQDTGDIPFDSGPPDLLHFRNCLCLLESWMSKENVRQEILERIPVILPGLALLLSLAKVLLGDNEGLAGGSLSNTLRLLLIVSQNNEDSRGSIFETPHLPHYLLRTLWLWYGEYFAPIRHSKEGGTKDKEAKARTLDRLCLALAVLTELVQRCNKPWALLQQPSSALDCLQAIRCLKTCQCGDRVTGIEILASIYRQTTEFDHGPLEATRAFIRGHTGVLLGMLCTSNREAEEVVLQALEGTTKEDKLRQIIDTVRDFTGTLSTVAARYNGSTDDSHNVAQARGEQVLSDGVEVAKKVLDALQALL